MSYCFAARTMKLQQTKIAILIFSAAAFFCGVARSQSLDQIGVTLLRAVTTNLNGAGIRVGQPEADDQGTPPGMNTWEVRPNAAGQPTNLFTYFNGPPPFNSASTYTNSLGLESGHAEIVAGFFYGIANGVATNVAHVDNYEADSFIEHYVFEGYPIS